MRVHEKRAWADGDTVAPDEINAELNHQFGVLNGKLDRDNFDNDLIETEKVTVDTFNIIERVKAVATVQLSRAEKDGPQTWYDVPGMSFSMATGDGRIKIEAQLHAAPLDKNTLPPRSDFDLGIMVDGNLIARTDSDGWLDESSKALPCAVPVGAGVHELRAVVRIAPGHRSADAPFTLDCYGRILWARFQRR